MKVKKRRSFSMKEHELEKDIHKGKMKNRNLKKKIKFGIREEIKRKENKDEQKTNVN